MLDIWREKEVYIEKRNPNLVILIEVGISYDEYHFSDIDDRYYKNRNTKLININSSDQ